MMDDIADILTSTRRIAVVGASNKPERAGNYVFGFLVAHGFEVTGVNPGLAGQTLHGRPSSPPSRTPRPLDMVDIFRASDQVGPVVDDAIRLGARTIWMQLGVVDTPPPPAPAPPACASSWTGVRCRSGAATALTLEPELTASHMRRATHPRDVT